MLSRILVPIATGIGCAAATFLITFFSVKSSIKKNPNEAALCKDNSVVTTDNTAQITIDENRGITLDGKRYLVMTEDDVKSFLDGMEANISHGPDVFEGYELKESECVYTGNDDDSFTYGDLICAYLSGKAEDADEDAKKLSNSIEQQFDWVKRASYTYNLLKAMENFAGLKLN